MLVESKDLYFSLGRYQAWHTRGSRAGPHTSEKLASEGSAVYDSFQLFEDIKVRTENPYLADMIQVYLHTDYPPFLGPFSIL